MSVVLSLCNCVTNYTLLLLKWHNFNEHIKLFALNMYFSTVKVRHICYILGSEFFLAQRKKQHIKIPHMISSSSSDKLPPEKIYWEQSRVNSNQVLQPLPEIRALTYLWWWE